MSGTCQDCRHMRSNLTIEGRTMRCHAHPPRPTPLLVPGQAGPMIQVLSLIPEVSATHECGEWEGVTAG